MKGVFIMQPQYTTHSAYPEHLITRFWAQVEKTSTCWIWTGDHTLRGYGRIGFNRKRIYAHRISYQLHNGSLSESEEVCHHCDNPPCVNPEHLFKGTHQENITDAVNKARNFTTLSPEQVREIRTLALQGVSRKYLADAFGVDISNIGYIVNRVTWKHLP